MTKKDFFRILIKLFGLYSIISLLFIVLPSQLFAVMYEIDLIGTVLILSNLLIIVLIIKFLIMKPDIIIKLFKLDQGFDEERLYIEKLNSKNIVKIAALIIGGILLIGNMPKFLSQTYFAFKTDIRGEEFDKNQQIYWATCGLNVVLGYLILTNFEKISNWFKDEEEKKNVA